MKSKYYCKKCGIIVELEDYDKQFGKLTKVYCSRCKKNTRMWKIIKTKMKGGQKQNAKFKRNSKGI